MPEHMNLAGLISLANFLATFFLGTLLFCRDRGNRVNVYAAGFNLLISGWALGYFLSRYFVELPLVIFSFKMCILFTVVINSWFLELVFALLEENAPSRKIAWIFHLTNLFCCTGAFTWFYNGWVEKYDYGLWPVASIGHTIYLALWALQVAYVCYCLYFYGVRKSNGRKRLLLIWVLVPSVIGFIGASTNWLIWYNVNFPPYFTIGVSFYALALTFAILRYRLFDFKSFLKALQYERMAAIGFLATSVNHDIRNPLYAIRNRLETLEDKLEKETEKESVRTAVGQINYIFSKLKTFNHYAVERASEGDAMTRNRALVGVAVKSVLDFIGYELERSKIEAVVEVEENIPPVVLNQIHLESILFNMVVNAFQAIEGPGKITVRARATKKFVELLVTDTGAGMSETEKNKLFKPHASIKGEASLGIGLYMTRELIEQNRGKISVRSEEGKGTTFKVSLPWLREQP